MRSLKPDLLFQQNLPFLLKNTWGQTACKILAMTSLILVGSAGTAIAQTASCVSPYNEVYGSAVPNQIWTIHGPTGAATQLTTSTFTNLTSTNPINGMASDHNNFLVYYGSGNGLYAWDVLNNDHELITNNFQSFLTQAGYTGRFVTLSSGGAGFYNGSLYVGVDGTSTAAGDSSDQDFEIFRVDFQSGSNGRTVQSVTPLGIAAKSGGNITSSTRDDWGDFIISNTGVILALSTRRNVSPVQARFWNFDLNTNTFTLRATSSTNYQLAKSGDGRLWGLGSNSTVVELNSDGTLKGSSNPTSIAASDAAECVSGQASVGDRVWSDVNGNGVQDAGEIGISGVTIEIYRDLDKDGVIDTGEPLLATQTTNTNGNYNFTGLLPHDRATGAGRNDFIVRVNGGVPAGATATTATLRAADLSSATQVFDTADFGYRLLAISGTLYQDSNGNSSLDTTEPKLPANITVTLYKDANSNNTIDTGEQVATTTTDSSGNYTFNNVVNDTYKVKVDTADTDISSGYVIGTSNDLAVTVNGANITSQNFGFITLPSSFPSCDARPFIAYGSPTDTLGALNTNTLTLDTVGTTTTLYNAIGYNLANNRIYGIQRPTDTTTNAGSNNLLAIGSNGVPVNLGAISGLPLTNFYNAGDVASDGFYYVVDGNINNANKTFYKIDINPTSPTYRRVVGQFNLSANYNSTSFFFGDIAFNPVDRQIYAVVNNSTNTSQQLIKIDPSSGTAIAVGTATTTDTDNFIGLFVDLTGNNVYGYQGNSRQMWRYNTATGARVLLANNLQTANNNADGTRCYNTPPIAPDLKISQTASSSRFAVGAANQSYSITVSIPATSTGITSVHGTITFTDQLPNGITIASTPTGTNWNCSASSGQNISCTYTGSLPVSNNSDLGGVITVPVNVAAAAVGTNKQSTATVPTLSAELNTSDNTATVAVDVVMSLNAQVLVVKRITAINGDRAKNPNDNTPLNSFVDDTTSTRKDDDNNPMWKSNYLLGAIDAGKVKPGDEIEYTVYFLNPGGANANNVRLCDRISANQDFKVDAYGTSNDMQLQLGTSTVLNLTRAADTSDRAQFISASGTVPTNCNLKATNDNGTLVIDVTGSANTGVPTLTALPGSTAQATPNDSYGYFRFITKVKP